MKDLGQKDCLCMPIHDFTTLLHHNHNISDLLNINASHMIFGFQERSRILLWFALITFRCIALLKWFPSILNHNCWMAIWRWRWRSRWIWIFILGGVTRVGRFWVACDSSPGSVPFYWGSSVHVGRSITCISVMCLRPLF
ncbi:hypothetical protein HS088_TW17G00467 [Tripterygium wilfordii]|uniref:Uncharacterized protein n=1 Tax=Tripterygium wilfordii TaxID=458696 RepID=A0A7J7CFH3_TRIWF|nr:hypothetical protein HS088_TW17G00467 [Tripterygium wilfordii]